MVMNDNSRIYVAGHRGLVGSAIWRELQRQGFKNLIGRTRQEANLLDADVVKKFFAETKPEFVSLRPPRSAVFWPTTHSQRRFFLKTCKSRTA